DRVVAVVGVRAAAVVDDDTDTGTAAQDVPANALDAAVGGSEGRATTGDVDTGVEASPAWTEQRREWTNRGTAPLAAARRRGAERATAAGEAWRLSHLRDDALDVGLHGRVARRGPPAPHVAVVGPGRVEVCGGDLLPVAVALPGAHRVAPGALVLNLARCQVGAGIAAVVGPRRVDVLVGARGGGDRVPRPVVVAGLVQAQRVEAGTNRTGVHRPTADPAEETGDGVADLVDGELWDAGDQLAEGSVLGEVAQAPNSVANHVLQSADGVGDEVHREAGDVGDPVPDVAGRVAEPVDDTAEEVAVLAAGLVPAGLLRHALHTAGQGGVVQLIDRLAAECSGDLRAQDGLTTAKVQRAAGRRDEGVHILTGRVAGQDAAECEVPLGGVADAARHSNLRDRADVEVVEDPVQSAEDAVIDDRVDDPDDRAGKRLAQAVPDILQAFDAAPEDRCDMLLDEAAEGVENRADVVPPDVADPLRDPSPDRLDDLV